MRVSLRYLAAVLCLSSFTSASPVSSESRKLDVPNKRQEAATPSVSPDAKRYFHNCKGRLAAEKEAWDGANTLAKAALDWQPGGQFQPDADLYWGNGSTDSLMVDRITNNLKNTVAVHDRNWIWPEASLDIWCAEQGDDGIPPIPDGAKAPWVGACGPRDNAYSYIRKNAYWFHLGYTIVFCPRFWDNVPNPVPGGPSLLGKRPLKQVLDWAKQYPRVASNPDILAANRAQTYFHELEHLDGLVGDPVIEDLVYQAGDSAGLALLYGTASKEVAPSFPQLDGEWGSTRNADNYAYFGNSIYFREQLKQQEPPQPTGDWKARAPTRVGPRSVVPTAGIEIQEAPFDCDDNATMTALLATPPEALDNEAVPIYEPPPPPPDCTPSDTVADPSFFNDMAAVFCQKLVPGIAAVVTLGGNDLSPPDTDTKTMAEFGFVPSFGQHDFGCALSCIDTYTNLTQTCQTDSQTLSGKANVTMGCGSYSFEIQAAT